MLLELTLTNFTIIEDLSVSLGPGLNIITGETGAGKSVLVDAVNIILGDKTSSEQIKSGKEEAHIEALFDISQHKELKKKLENSGFESSTDELLIKRVVYRNSRSRVFINGSLSTLNILKSVTQGLVDIFSQHEHQTLLREENHLKILDDFGKTGHEASRVKDLFQKYKSIKKELEDLAESQQEKLEKEDYIKYQVQEIDSAEISIGEDEKLEDEKLRLVHQEKLRATALEAYESLYEQDNAVLGTLRGLINDFKDAGKIDPALEEIGKTIETGMLQIEEAALSVRDYTAGLESDVSTLEMVEDRLHLIKSLKRKYGDSISDIITKRDELAKELTQIKNYEDAINKLTQQSEEQIEELLKLSEILSNKRKKSSKELTRQLEKELRQVGIKGGSFHIAFNSKELSSSGIDHVTFLFSANPDEDPKPLVKIASGGELSRIMLVLKEVIARVEGGAVIIFDEADSGVGGAVAEAVGLKIRKLSQSYQVICITHLPQVAKFADSHLTVTKSHEDNKTHVTIKNLEGDERVIELARMIGGFNITQKTIDAAHEMLKH